MKGIWRLGAFLLFVAALAGCGMEQAMTKQHSAPVTAAGLQGNLSYQDVLEKGETVHNLAMTADAKRIWVGTHAGLYSSSSSGLWGEISPELGNVDVTGWFVDPQNPKHMTIAGNSGVMRSTDGGKKWEKIGKGLPDLPNIRSMTGIREGEQIRLFAFVSSEGVYQSTDAGEHWKLWLPLDQEVFAMDYSPQDQHIYVATQYGLLYNQKDMWETESLPGVEQVYSTAVDKRNGALYAATEQGIMQKLGGEWKLIDAKAPEKLIAIAAGEGDYQLVGIGESAFVYSLSNEKWSKWE